MSAATHPVKRGYTIQEAAAYLGIKEWAVYQEMREGRLVGKKRGATTLFDQKELDRYFDDLPDRA